MFFFQELIEELPNAAAVIMAQLSIKAWMNSWKRKGRAAAKYDMKMLHFSDTFKPKHYRDINEDHKKSIIESHIFTKEI